MPHAFGLVPFALRIRSGSRGVLEASRREPICLAVDAVAHARVAVAHVPAVRDGTAIGRSRPPVAVATDIEERTAVVVASGQGGKAVGVRACIGDPQGAIGLERCARRGGSTHIGLQSIPRRGVGQVPNRGASRQSRGIVVHTTIGGTVASRISITPAIATGGGIVQILRQPSLRANYNGFVGLFSTGQGIGRSVVGAVLRIGGNRCRRGSRARRRYDGT